MAVTLPVAPRPLPSAGRVWLRAIRPYAYPASVVPVAAGAGSAALAGSFSPLALVLTLVGCMALQTASNLVNEYYDWKQGADHEGSLGTGHVIQDGWLSPRRVLAAGIGTLLLGIVCGLILALQVGWPILALGLVGVVLAVGYTAPPLKLAYRGLGEIAVFFAFGPLMVLGGLLVHRPSGGVVTALAASLPVGLLVAAILHANNVRDLEDDRRVGKRTLATLLGHRGARQEYDVLLAGAYVSVVLAVALQLLPWPSLAAFASLPLALRVHRLVWRETEPRRLGPALPTTAALHLRFGLLLALGLFASLLLPR